MSGVSGRRAPGAAVLLAVFGFAVVASEKPPDSYVKNMKETNAAAADLRKSVEAKDYAAAAKQAAQLRTLFENTLSFWEQRKADDAIGFAKAGAKAADDLESAAKTKNAEAVTAANTALQASCKSCHDAHRERLPDGSSEIK
jgi:cytochrome c556